MGAGKSVGGDGFDHGVFVFLPKQTQIVFSVPSFFTSTLNSPDTTIWILGNYEHHGEYDLVPGI